MADGIVWFLPFEERFIIWLQGLFEGTFLQTVLIFLNNFFSFLGGDLLCVAVMGNTDVGSVFLHGSLQPLQMSGAAFVVDIYAVGSLADDPQRAAQFLQENGQKMDIVINFSVKNETLMARLTGRRVCKGCGASYHVINIPPKQEGICDICGGELEQRKDDNEETAANRINVYEEQTAPLIGYYKETGALADFDGELPLDEIFEKIVEAIGE